MRSPRFKIWSLCLAVVVSAVVVKLAMVVGAYLTVTTSLLFLGPMTGIVLDRYRGGSGVAGGVIAGILSGFVIATFMELYVGYLYPGRPFSWPGWMTLSIVFVMLEAFCGWHWGRSYRSWHLSKASRTAANPKEHEI